MLKNVKHKISLLLLLKKKNFSLWLICLIRVKKKQLSYNNETTTNLDLKNLLKSIFDIK